jgi:hypothetical protein
MIKGPAAQGEALSGTGQMFAKVDRMDFPLVRKNCAIILSARDLTRLAAANNLAAELLIG